MQGLNDSCDRDLVEDTRTWDFYVGAVEQIKERGSQSRSLKTFLHRLAIAHVDFERLGTAVVGCRFDLVPVGIGPAPVRVANHSLHSASNEAKAVSWMYVSAAPRSSRWGSLILLLRKAGLRDLESEKKRRPAEEGAQSSCRSYSALASTPSQSLIGHHAGPAAARA